MRKRNCPSCFRLISEETRAKIIKKLKKKPENVSRILKEFSLTQPTISHHLRILEKSGILYSKKIGREIYYYLNKKYPCKKCLLFKIPMKI